MLGDIADSHKSKPRTTYAALKTEKGAPPNSMANEPPISNAFDHVINLLFGYANRLCYSHSFNKHFLSKVNCAGIENPEIV